MSISKDQVELLLKMVASTQGDAMDCDGCMEQIAEFAESELQAQEPSQAMANVQRHLEQCPCCQDEFEALLEALRNI